ncbi:MAG: hypothetical protein JWN86_3817 [Planctomycetota bacterium]|nr:hypothetical protein [Planctomycetota bacterium]
MKRSMATAVLLAATMIGCDKPIENPDPIALDKIPAGVMKIAKRELPGVDFEKAWTGKVEGKLAYEIRGRKADGTYREIKISESGKVIEIE